MKKFVGLLLKVLPFIATILFVLFIVSTKKEFTVDFVLSYIPQNLTLAALIFMVMYALKSLSVLFPILVLQVAGGVIFSPVTALILNCIGTAISYTIPYLIGRMSGREFADQLVTKHRKISYFINLNRGSDSFTSFILRSIGCLPADIVSMYLGSIGTKFIPYVLWSVIGTLPGLIPATFMGAEITNPKSMAFIVTLVATILSSVISIVIFVIIKKKRQKTTDA